MPAPDLSATNPRGQTRLSSHTSSISSPMIFVGLIVVYKIALSIAYVQVADSYAYQNLFFVLGTAWTQILGWVLLFGMMPLFYKAFNDPTPSGNIMSLLSLFSVIPIIVCISYRSDYSVEYIALIIIFWVVLLVLWSLTRPVYIGSGELLRSRYFYIIVAFTLSATVVLYSYFNTGLRLHFDLIDVYDIRTEAREYAAPGGISYIIALADNILAVLMVVFIAQRNWIAAGTLALVIFVNFSITGTKQVLFVPFLGVAGYYAIRSFSQTYRIIAGAIALCAISILEASLLGSTGLHTLFAYRVLFIPAELHNSYYSYFQYHDLLYYSQSLLKVYASTEQDNIQFVLGEYSIGDYTARANNGLFSDAYTNLGVIGVVLYPFIIVGYLRLLDGSIYGLPQRMIFVVSVYVAFVLLGMTLTSALITSGLLFLVLLLYSIPRGSVTRTVRATVPSSAS